MSRIFDNKELAGVENSRQGRVESLSKSKALDKEPLASLDGQQIKKLLDAWSFSQDIRIYDRLDSTNKKAKDLAKEGAIFEGVIIADEQTEGRGRLGRAWLSKKGTGIWMSIVLRPVFSPNHAAKLTVISALAVSQAVYRLTGTRLLIKWPNDLVLNNKKICGILTELRADKEKIHYAVVGIGINTASQEGDFPEDLASIASSILIETGSLVDRKQLIAQILREFQDLYSHFTKGGDFSSHRALYRELSASLGKRVRVLGPKEEFEGLAIDLTDSCSLLVRKDSGEIEEVMAGDVSVRGMAGYI